MTKIREAISLRAVAMSIFLSIKAIKWTKVACAVSFGMAVVFMGLGVHTIYLERVKWIGFASTPVPIGLCFVSLVIGLFIGGQNPRR